MKSPTYYLRRSIKARKHIKNVRNRRRTRLSSFEPLEKRCLLAASPLEFGFEQESSGEDISVEHVQYLPPRIPSSASPTDGFLSDPWPGDPLTVATNYMQRNPEKLGLTADDLQTYEVTDQYESSLSGVTHIYLRQTFNGIPVVNTSININVAPDGSIVSIGGGFVKGLERPETPGDLEPAIDGLTALGSFADGMGIEMSEDPGIATPPHGRDQQQSITPAGVAIEPVSARLRYVPTTSGGVDLAWELGVNQLDQIRYFNAYVNAGSGQLIDVVDLVEHASYNVFPHPVETPDDGSRQVVVDPHDPVASPFGWHDVNGLPGADFFDTRGNNVFAQEARDTDPAVLTVTPAPNLGTRPSGGADLNFDFPLDLAQNPSESVDAAITNLFYWQNLNHDIHARHGFTEAAGNAQSLNYTGMGQGKDPVLAYAQAGAGLPAGPFNRNNAFMFTPPDGQSPVTAMFVWEFTSPIRDGDFDSQIITHEHSHMVSNRMTGGPADATALTAIQSSGMGEGWSDFHALLFTQKESDQPGDANPIGTYVLGESPSGDGFRTFPYSFDMTVNPLTYADFNQRSLTGFPHDEGEIWASALWDLNWLLIEKYGFTSDLLEGAGGNTLALRLVNEAMKLQPANPTFLQARDAIVQADLILNDGVNLKEIWTAFARRGFGLSADNGPQGDVLGPNQTQVNESFDLPISTSRVEGTVWQDDDGDGTFDAGEPGIANWEVFVDLNENGIRDPLEPTQLTDDSGRYTFEFFAPGTFVIDQVVEGDFTQTFPADADGHEVTVTANRAVSDVNFGNRPGDFKVTGVKFNDLNGNGERDSGEPGVGNVWIYVDFDDDMRIDLGEPATRTAADGSYTLTVEKEGTFFVREVAGAGWEQTFPGSPEQGHQITVTDGALNVAVDFGNRAMNDFGDAPAPYPTLLEDNGAVHPILAGFHLGATVDGEPDGIPSEAADGDDQDGVDDEDGVEFNEPLSPGATASVDVTVSTGSSSPGRLNGWIDLNQDGEWSGAEEHLIHDLQLPEGTHTIPLEIPVTADSGLTYARFRYGYRRFDLGEKPVGSDDAGEVEDYQVRLLGPDPNARADQLEVLQDSTANELDVLANDIPSQAGALEIASVTQPNRGGSVLVGPDLKSLRYTPAPGFFGTEQFRYTVIDPAGNTDTAQVTVTVLPAIDDLVAVDDAFVDNDRVAQDSASNPLPVLDNDLSGQDPPIAIVAFSGPDNGSVTIDDRGDGDPSNDQFLYTPNGGFTGFDQFTYTIEDTEGVQDSATVTVQVGDLPSGIVEYRLEPADTEGNPIQTVSVGDDFVLRGLVEDLRTSDPDLDTPGDQRGIFAGFFDVLFDVGRVSLAGDISFGPEYQNFKSGNTMVPGIIDEVGAFQTGGSPLGPDEFVLFSVPMTATSAGTADFVGDPADLRSEVNENTPQHDTLTFEPPQDVPLADMRFVNSTLTVVGAGSLPIAVQDTFTIPAGDNPHSFDVLNNDVETNNPPLTVSAVSGASNGVASPGLNGEDVQYTPDAGFEGTDQFTYTVTNDAGLEATAQVTVQVGSPPKDLAIRPQVFSGGSPVTEVSRGSEFELRLFVQDLRDSDGDGDGVDERGIFAAYTDLLFDSEFVSTVDDPQNPRGFDVEFGPEYRNGRSGNIDTPNMIDELGAFQTGSEPLGADEVLLATVTFNADQAGSFNFRTDPADITPQHDSLLFEPPGTVPLERIDYRTTSITIVSGAAEFQQNPRNRYDVNADEYVSAIDVLLPLNKLNNDSHGEGETSGGVYYDVNGDGSLSSNDVLHVINYLNHESEAGGEGEGSSFGRTRQSSATRSETASSGNGSSDQVLLGGPLLPTPLQQPSEPSQKRGATAGTLSDVAAQGDFDQRVYYRQDNARNELFARWTSDDDKAEEETDAPEPLDELLEDISSVWYRQ